MAQERHNWLVDGSHTGNIHGSVRVSGRAMPAREAIEMGLIAPVAFIALTTHGACAAGVAWVDTDDTHARLLRLVADKRSELPKCPGMTHTSLLPSNRCSLADLCQILQSDCLTGRVRFSHQRLADAVIHIFLKAVFTPRILAQAPARTAGVCQLQPPAMVVSALATHLDLLPTVRLTVRVGSKVDDAQVNSQVAGRFIKIGRGFRLGNTQIPYIVASDQFRAADLPRRVVQIATLELTQDELPNHPTRQGVAADAVPAAEAIGTGVVADAAVSGEGRTRQ